MKLSNLWNFVADTNKRNMRNVFSGEGIFDPGGFFSDTQSREASGRLSKYKTFREAYEGRGFNSMDADGNIEMSVNLNGPIINKTVDWLCGKPIEIEAVPGNQALSDRIMDVFEENDLSRQFWCCGHSGAVAGDGYLYVTTDGDVANPIGKKTFIKYIKPQFVHPIFHPLETDKIAAVMIQFPMDVPDSFATSGYSSGQHVFSRVITENKIYEYLDDKMQEEIDNVFKIIPVFHAPNLLNAFRWFGTSDLADVWLLNELRNDLSHSLKKILEYNADPTTIIIGASATNLEKGSERVWSIKNPDARVQLLEMNSDMAAVRECIASLKQACLEMASIPEFSLGMDAAVSNTSAAALEVRYMCLMEKTRRKRITYGRALLGAAKLIAQIEMAREPALFGKLIVPEQWRRLAVIFPDPLPRDMEKVLLIEEQAIRMGVQSRYGALREFKKKRIEETMIEIIADDRMQMLKDVEQARAVEGNVPNLHANFTGSLGMHVEKDMATRREDDLVLKLQSQLQQTEKVVDNTV